MEIEFNMKDFTDHKIQVVHKNEQLIRRNPRKGKAKSKHTSFGQR